MLSVSIEYGLINSLSLSLRLNRLQAVITRPQFTCMYCQERGNLLNQEKAAKGGIHAKRLQAGWNNDCLLSILKG